MYRLIASMVLILPILVAPKSTAPMEIVVRVNGGARVAQQLAWKTGHHFKGPVLGFEDTYVFVVSDGSYSNYQKRGSEMAKRLEDDDRVLWADVQQGKVRQKRAYKTEAQANLGRIRRTYKKIYKKPLHARTDRTFNDELWPQEWYLQDTRSRPDLPKLDLNVLPVYKAGITGKGVRVSVLDDGIEYTHDDLKDNYDAEISYDCNDEDDDPMPRYEGTHFNSHGTRCAGEIAMAANNGKCGVGIAYNAKIGGVKLLDGLVTDRIEGTALGYAQHLVDVYSASWGPNDDGKTVDGPGRLAREALERGVRAGRGGKGVIYVWASGNGGSKGDNCNCDGYLASPFTVSIGSASQKGEFPWYGEACASTLAVTYSSGAYKDQMIATTDLHNECTIKHTGTSASAPLAAGIIALALEVNQELTWRDVQHLIVWTSEVISVADNPGWQKNAAGLWFNTKFGFGLMNAYGLAKAAANWTNVPMKRICTVKPIHYENANISYGHSGVVYIYTTGCKDSQDEINYVEHVELQITINYSIRGALEVYLKSPCGSNVQLLNTRKNDLSDDGFNGWTFMSVMTWGEAVQGLWAVTVIDNTGPTTNKGSLGDVTLILHGTKQLPEHMKQGPRQYNQNYNKISHPHNILTDLDNTIIPDIFNDYYNYY